MYVHYAVSKKTAQCQQRSLVVNMTIMVN